MKKIPDECVFTVGKHERRMEYLRSAKGATFYLVKIMRIDVHQSQAPYKSQCVIILRPHCLKNTCSNNRTLRSKFEVTASRDN